MILSWALQQGQLLALSMGDFLDATDADTAVIRLMALYNLCVGYFSSANMMKGFLDKDVNDPDLIAKQKVMLKRIGRGYIQP